MISKAELEFGKLGYVKYENKDIIVFYKPYAREDFRAEDITFCKNTKRIIFYQGTNYGTEAFACDFNLINAIRLQVKELENEGE